MKVVDIIEMLEEQIKQLQEKYCDECQEWSCENCWAKPDEVEIDIDENWYSDEYRRIGEDERDEVEE